MFVLVVEIGRSWTGLPVVSIINWFTFTSQCKQPGTVMQHIIQISAVQIATPCTVAYQQLCLVTVIFNSETQLFFSHANSLKKTILNVPWEVQMLLQMFEGFWNWSRTRASSLNVMPLAHANLFCETLLSPLRPPSPFFFQQGFGDPQCYHSLILFESGRVWAGKGAKRASWVVRRGNSVISKGRVVKNNWAI